MLSVKQEPIRNAARTKVRKTPADASQRTIMVARIATGEIDDKVTEDGKNAAAGVMAIAAAIIATLIAAAATMRRSGGYALVAKVLVACLAFAIASLLFSRARSRTLGRKSCATTASREMTAPPVSNGIPARLPIASASDATCRPTFLKTAMPRTVPRAT